MAMQTTVSNLLAKLGDKGRQAHEAHKNDEVQYGTPGLPAGIEGGIAQLRKMQFGIYKDGKNKGQIFFYAMGVAKQPTHLDGVPVRNGQTTIGPEPLCDTPTATGKRKSFDDHYAWVLNAVRAFLEPNTTIGFDEMEATMAALVEAKPHFKFRTWKGAKQTTGQWANREPRVIHEWNGRVDYSEEVDAMAGTEDHSEVLAPSDNGEAVNESTETDSEAASEQSELPFNEFEEQGDTSPSPSDEEKEAQYKTLSLDQLVEKAKADDAIAVKVLVEMAKAVGNSEEEVVEANDWQDVADMITKKKEEQTKAKLPVDNSPKVGDSFLYRPTDQKTKKPSDKMLEIKILEVDNEAKTVTAKGPKVTYKSLPWNRLEVKG